jgi:two-component system, OmpR family, KDP operon response regulator KdpE
VSDLLLVEDDPQLRRALSLTLRARGHHVLEAGTAGDARTTMRHRQPELIILDLGLPDLDGIDLLRQLRQEGSDVPVIVLSARQGQSDKVAALDAGADDYLTKPFGLDELLARIRAALRRAAPPVEDGTVVTPDFTIDLGRCTVQDGAGNAVHLTPTEWGILGALVRAGGLLVPSADLLRDIWGPQYQTQTNYLRVYMAQLRRKLEPDPAHPRYLITSPGLGYRFNAASIGDP